MCRKRKMYDDKNSTLSSTLVKSRTLCQLMLAKVVVLVEVLKRATGNRLRNMFGCLECDDCEENVMLRDMRNMLFVGDYTLDRLLDS